VRNDTEVIALIVVDECPCRSDGCTYSLRRHAWTHQVRKANGPAG